MVSTDMWTADNFTAAAMCFDEGMLWLNSGLWFATPSMRQIINWSAFDGLGIWYNEDTSQQTALKNLGCKNQHANKQITEFQVINDDAHKFESRQPHDGCI